MFVHLRRSNDEPENLLSLLNVLVTVPDLVLLLVFSSL